MYPVGSRGSNTVCTLGILSSVILDQDQRTVQYAIHIGNVDYHSILEDAAYRVLREDRNDFQAGELIVAGNHRLKQITKGCSLGHIDNWAVCGLSPTVGTGYIPESDKLFYREVLSLGCLAMCLAISMWREGRLPPEGYDENGARFVKFVPEGTALEEISDTYKIYSE